ncbi:uncharacterized protein BP01DRAFT_175002 [Aspergillus saccharolyticus JOP 1030-1]|uniref:Uncharacterized protein n=1 Tax=Aspergillus saccharolyticus JOP 1030-1 TaxID=1450539 RepID=A0A318ZKI0_9EURO|nr:hypothetical protein BP01DRAFT_175002 [Aspergillus saccharolyticus JOP 1030-1]PYH48016.1 hypothetical protein BP01DRAFT_175002 [Aspergillus saccharolyticus JOP 1030-1]
MLPRCSRLRVRLFSIFVRPLSPSTQIKFVRYYLKHAIRSLIILVAYLSSGPKASNTPTVNKEIKQAHQTGDLGMHVETEGLDILCFLPASYFWSWPRILGHDGHRDSISRMLPNVQMRISVGKRRGGAKAISCGRRKSRRSSSNIQRPGSCPFRGDGLRYA